MPVSPNNRKWIISLVFYSLFIIYGTTLPFDFTLSPEVISENLATFFSFTQDRPILPDSEEADAIANFLFFIPFGFFFYNARIKSIKRETHLLNIFTITLIGCLLSVFVETLQLFTHFRTTSLADILTNSFGSLSGAIFASFLIRSGWREKIGDYLAKHLQDPALLLLVSTSAIMVIAGLVPFDFTLSPVILSAKIASKIQIDYNSILYPKQLYSLIFLYGSLGYVYTRYFRIKYQDQSFRLKRILYPALLGAGMSLAIEMMQLLVRSRSFNPADIIVAFLGIIYGIVIHSLFHLTSASNLTTNPDKLNNNGKYLLFFITLNYLGFIFYKYAYPFSFNLNEPFLSQKVNFFLFNILSYSPSNRLIEVGSIIAKNAAMYFPGGLILREHVLMTDDPKKTILIVGLTIVLIFLLKAVQLFNTTQVPLLFDYFGILAGTLSGYFIWREYRGLFSRV